jgi:hypothetical protein
MRLYGGAEGLVREMPFPLVIQKSLNLIIKWFERVEEIISENNTITRTL